MKVKAKAKDAKIPYVHVVTTDWLPGHAIKEVKGLVWGTTVRSRFVGSELIALARILVGGEVQEYTQLINEARQHVIRKLVNNAAFLGANAVIGTQICASSQVVPGSVEIFAYGTAVIVEREKGKKK